MDSFDVQASGTVPVIAPSPNQSVLRSTYVRLCGTPSDINEHLATLRHYASKGSSVVECGVRNVVSSYAFAVGLMEASETPKLYLVDPYRSPSVNTFLSQCSFATFVHESDLTCPLVETDMLFLDTWHVYGQLKRELDRWNPVVRNYIAMHDTTVDGVHGETIRYGWNSQKQSEETGIPVEEIERGLRPAIQDFLHAHPEWTLEEEHTHNNGLTILRRTGALRLSESTPRSE